MGGLNYGNNEFQKNFWDLSMLNGCNVHEKLGSIIKDLGYSQIGSPLQAGKDITGLFNFRQSAGVQKMLATVNDSGDDDTQLFYSTGGDWTEVTAAETAWANEANGAIEMEAMDNYCYIVGYDSTDGFLPPASLTGTTFSTSTNVTDMPNAKYIKRYRDRIYIANCDISGTAHPYRTYFSTVPSAGSITWTVATNFVDVDYSEEVKGLGENWDRLMIFTQFSAYGYNQSEFKKLWDTGCANHRTIKNHGAFMFWGDFDGIYVSTGGRPQKISGKVDKFYKTGTPANYFAEIVEEEYIIYIGTVTVDGIAYANCALRYHIPSQTWRIREYVDDIKIFAKYNNASKMELWHGDDSGEVMKHSKYTDTTPIYTDDGSDIRSHFKISLLDLGVPQDRKTINKILTYSKYAQYLKLSARIIDKNENILMDWQLLGELTNYITEHTVKINKGNFLEIQGRSKDGVRGFEFDGMSIDFDKSSTNK